MFAQVAHLQYWKSEHNEQTCEDAYGENVAAGLFAVADGAGTTLFANIWAKILVEAFLTTPLMSNNPFEVEWWVRQAQERHKQEAPDPGNMAWNALQKAQNQGSHSTLVTLRVLKSEADTVEAELLVFGDSCVLIGNPNIELVQSFPLDTPADFERAPICVPSKRSIFNRHFHQCHVKHIELAPDDVVVLATDAVSKWIVSAGGGHYTQPKQAFQELIAQTPASWATFITECRAKGEMVDDDSTALIIALQQEALASGVPLGVMTEHSKAIRENRKRAFAKAMEARNKELAAIAFGDGVDLSLEGVTISPDQVQQARQVADAMQRVLQVLRQEINSPNAAAKVGPVWQQHATLLLDEPCAANLRQTLTHMGVSVTPPAPAQPSSPSAPQETLSVEPVLVQIQREREQLDLERHFVRALRADDDQAIVSAHNDIQQSLYTEIITFTPQEKQRIGLAYQRQRVQFALKSTNAAQMAQAYELVANKPQIVSLSPQELQLLRIAHTFIVAYHTDTDEAILTAFDEMQHSPSYQLIKLTPQEEDRIGLAWKRRMAREHEQVNLDPIGNATLFPEGKHHPEPDEAKQMQGRSWFAKLMWWKGS